jgi:hypothetical protein
MVLGQDFQVNSWTTGYQQHPAVSATPSGEMLVVWESPRDDPAVTYRDGIYAQRFEEGPFFGDGFESGDTSGWSSTNP